MRILFLNWFLLCVRDDLFLIGVDGVITTTYFLFEAVVKACFPNVYDLI